MDFVIKGIDVKLFILGALCFCLSNMGFAQKGSIDLDSMLRQGYILEKIPEENQLSIHFALAKNLPYKVYYPNQIKGYSLNDGSHFVSKEVLYQEDSQFVFLERKVKGGINFYTLEENSKHRMFVEKNDVLMELKDKETYSDTLQTLFSDCKGYEEYVPLIKFKRRSLARSVALYNRCYSGYFPVFRKGFFLGGEQTRLIIKNQYSHQTNDEKLDFGKKNSIIIGLFMDFPLGTNTSWYLNVQGYYLKSEYKLSVTDVLQFGSNYRITDYSFIRNNINLPALVEYRTNAKHVRANVKLGPMVSYNLNRYGKITQQVFDSRTGVKESHYSGNTQILSSLQVSGMFGVGGGLSLNQKLSMEMDLRYTKGFGLSPIYNESSSGFQLLVSFLY